MQRVLILGCAGAGKTHLARCLAERTGLPVINLDRHYWRAGWVAPDNAVWTQQVSDLVEAPAWIMDGNYGGTLTIRLIAADTAILLDLPTWRCVFRVLWRTVQWHGRTRPADMAPGCQERFDFAFMRYILSYRRVHRPRVINGLAHFSGRVVLLRTQDEIDEFIAEIS